MAAEKTLKKRRGRPPKTQGQKTEEKKAQLLEEELDETPLGELTLGKAKKKIVSLEKKIERLKRGAYCSYCGKFKPKSDFYTSTCVRSKGKVTPICSDCARGIAYRRDRNGDDHEPTLQSIQEALYYLNKPFLDIVYDASVAEAEKKKTDPLARSSDQFGAYMRIIAMPQYIGKEWRDSDFFKQQVVYEDEKTIESVLEGREDQDTYVDFVKNKKDVKRLLSYDPFEKESISDQPFLYSQLLGLLDASEDMNDDMMRVASCISIVRGFLQQSKIDDAIAKIMANPNGIENNTTAIKGLQESKAKITAVIKDLAAESCISLKNNKDAKKGENTWTGKLRKIRSLPIREARVNGFDIDTCRGMQQVADISMSAIVDKLHLDESEWADMVATQREYVVTANRKADAYAEAARLLLKENIDLRNTLQEHDLLRDDELLDLNDVVNTYISADGSSDSGDIDAE